ncbi:Mu transposase C-terminal domain-containing protein [Marinobacter sp. C2H3]|uniref:Mu transposase C-terminal domain-containing protein n=1 Tax=Marinobacter sp. C2H3 TaxID=3119003 RepID=UPI00300EB097
MSNIDSKAPYNESFEPRRGRIDIEVGALVQSQGTVYRIIQLIDFDSVIGTNVETGRSVPLRIGELRIIDAVENPSPEAPQDLSDIVDEDWQIAQKRFSAIKPLINEPHIGRQQAEKRAAEVSVNVATIYRWLKRYKAYGSATALIPMKRGWKAGNRRITKEADDIIAQVIKDYYLTLQRPPVKKAVIEVHLRCSERGITPPSHMTVRARIAQISEKDRLRARGFRERARNRFTPVPGRFPNADYPLAVVQIDHTPADIILVDDVYRKPIGRPWITLAVDVCTRMVTGYYLSFDPPSETSVAMCVANSILPKDEWLLLNHVNAQWPVWGIPKTIHVDNGADFRSNNFQQSCLVYGIDLEFRPVRQPRYGGHIERLLGTLLREIHELPGTTFSSIKAREGYDAEKHAALTKTEFETWLITLICKVYHQRLHTNLGMSPSRKWEIGIFGDANTPGVGVPPQPADRMTALLDFLPSFRRTVQAFGVTIDGMRYYAEALRPWINSTDPDTGRKRQMVFRRDPRDISCLWFFDPDIGQYFKIPFADQALPTMSIWEYQQAREKLKREGLSSINEHQILRSISELRVQVEEAQENSKRARRKAQRRKEHERKLTPKSSPENLAPSPQLHQYDGLIEGDIDTYGDIA